MSLTATAQINLSVKSRAGLRRLQRPDGSTSEESASGSNPPEKTSQMKKERINIRLRHGNNTTNGSKQGKNTSTMTGTDTKTTSSPSSRRKRSTRSQLMTSKKFKRYLLKKKKLSPATTKHVLVIIRQVYNKMIAWGLYDEAGPTKGLKRRLSSTTSESGSNQRMKPTSSLKPSRKKAGKSYEISLLSLHTGMRADEGIQSTMGPY